MIHSSEQRPDPDSLLASSDAVQADVRQLRGRIEVLENGTETMRKQQRDLVGDLDKRRFNQWLSHLLQTQGTDIFRMKGIISLKGEKERFVFQGVHMLFDGRPDRPWGANARRNQLIFIGRNLDKTSLRRELDACGAQS